jgi:hypothetical protein
MNSNIDKRMQIIFDIPRLLCGIPAREIHQCKRENLVCRDSLAA